MTTPAPPPPDLTRIAYHLPPKRLLALRDAAGPVSQGMPVQFQGGGQGQVVCSCQESQPVCLSGSLVALATNTAPAGKRKGNLRFSEGCQQLALPSSHPRSVVPEVMLCWAHHQKQSSDCGKSVQGLVLLGSERNICETTPVARRDHAISELARRLLESRPCCTVHGTKQPHRAEGRTEPQACTAAQICRSATKGRDSACFANS